MNFMRGLFNRFANFMQGRYGTDKLNNALWVLLLILWFVNIFVWNRVARYIIDGIMLLIIVLICFRMFSRNIVARSAENRKFFPIYNAVTGWFKLTFKKIRDRKDYRYIKCPVCKAQLRVRNKKAIILFAVRNAEVNLTKNMTAEPRLQRNDFVIKLNKNRDLTTGSITGGLWSFCNTAYARQCVSAVLQPCRYMDGRKICGRQCPCGGRLVI